MVHNAACLVFSGPTTRWTSLACRALRAGGMEVFLVSDDDRDTALAQRNFCQVLPTRDLEAWIRSDLTRTLGLVGPGAIVGSDGMLELLGAARQAGRPLAANGNLGSGLAPGDLLDREQTIQVQPGQPRVFATPAKLALRLLDGIEHHDTAPVSTVTVDNHHSPFLLPQLPHGKRRFDMQPMLWEAGRAVLRGQRPGQRRTGFFEALRRTLWRRPCPLPWTMSEDRLNIVYVLDRMVVAGGVLSVIQLVNELILRGMDARIACCFEDPAIYRWMPMLTRPLVYPNLKTLARELPDCEIAVATMWTTVDAVAALRERGAAQHAAYFVQDYESGFYPEGDRRRQRVIDSYARIPNRIVKSHWLKQKLAEHDAEATIIPLGLDLDVFSPTSAARPPHIVAMARPGTPWRGFDRLCEVLRRLHQQRPDVQISLFGAADIRPRKLGFPAQLHGVIEDVDQLADLYRSASIFIDTSTFQGFGRCGLEAMASGCACVLSGAGGVESYAQDGKNALVINDDDPDTYNAALLDLLADPQLHARLVHGGLQTVRQFDLDREADQTLEYFLALARPADIPARAI